MIHAATCIAQIKAAFGGFMDYPVDETGTTFRQLVEKKWPGFQFDHIHHAGNSSGVVDGDSALVLASPEYARAHGLKPRAKVVMTSNSGGSPAHILNQPGPATLKALKRAGMTVNEREQTAELLNRIASNRAVIVIEHDMEFVRKIAKTVTVLHQGKVLAEGSMDKVQSDEKVIEVYLGH